MNQPDIFANYEINNNKWYSTIFKILAGLIPVYLIVIASVVYVPAIRDAVFVAFMFADTNTKFGDKDYKKTEIGTATIIDLADDGKFKYPEGYFSTEDPNAAPEELVSMTQNTTDFGNSGFSSTIPPDGIMPTFNPTINSAPPIYTPPTPSPYRPQTYTPPRTPKMPRTPRTPRTKSPNILDGMLPKPTTKLPPELMTPPTNSTGATPNAETSASAKPTKKPTPKTTPTPNQTTTAQNNAPDSDKPDNFINQKPFKDLAFNAIKLIDDKKINLNDKVKVQIKGVLDKDGKFTEPLKLVSQPEGSADMVTVTSDFITALGDSGMLGKLKVLYEGSAKREMTFNVTKDDKFVTVVMESDAGNVEQARKLSSGINLLLDLYKRTLKEEELELIKNANVTSDKTKVFVNWQVTTPYAIEKIQKKLADAKSKPQSTNVSNLQTTQPLAK